MIKAKQPGAGTKRIVLRNGEQTAAFVRSAAGWAPDWFYLNKRPMLRFKDHEWLSIGHVHPGFAEIAQPTGNGGCEFRGLALYGKTAVPWSITVTPDPVGGFAIAVAFTPTESLELLEAYSTFETPYEYAGRETVTTVIGMNPVVQWQGTERKSPPVWEHPAWAYSRREAVRMTAPCNAPFLCQAITGAGKLADRVITIVGDWKVCQVHDIYVTPTRNLAGTVAGQLSTGIAERRGYKYIVGALNWSSAYAKDPNVFYKGGGAHRQRVVVDYAAALPGGTFDTATYRAWERTLTQDLPADGHIAAGDRTGARGVTWQTAVGWLRDVFCGPGVEGLYLAGKGVCTYAEGSRPKAGGDYGWFWWPQWNGGFHYRAVLTGDRHLATCCERNDAEYARWVKGRTLTSHSIAMGVTTLPALWWLRGAGRKSKVTAALRASLTQALTESVAENGKPRAMDFGSQSSTAETFFLAADIYGNSAFSTQGLLLTEEFNRQLDGEFWAFNMGQRGNLTHGGQVRPLGHGHAIMANLLAWRQTGRPQYLEAARRFARYLAAICYATHNGSQDRDFDWRGWANGSNAGRDQIAEFPPWETQNSLLCIAALMDVADLEPGFYGVLWYIARTGLAQFPAARTLKRLLDEQNHVMFVPRNTLGSERDFYDNLPYLAYENPHDQTLLASYQGTDCLLGELVYGGGLAVADDPRLGVFVPGAACLNTDLASRRTAHVWNPLAAPVRATVSVTWPDGTRSTRRITIAAQQVLKLLFRHTRSAA